MRFFRPLFLMCIAVAALQGSSARVAAEEFRNDAGRWRVQIPANWVRFAPAKLAPFKAAGNQPWSFVHEGFEMVVNRPEFNTPPFLVIQEDRGPRSPLETYEMLEQSFNTEFRREFEAAAGPGVKLGAVVLDRKKNRVVAEFDMVALNGERLRGVLYAFLGNKSVVIIQCFAQERDFPHHKATFDTMADSFRYDEGSQFVPFDFAKAGWICGGVCAGTLCLVVVLIAGLLLLFRLTAKK